MIIGMIGPVGQDTELATQLLTEDKEIQVIDSIQLLRLAGRKLIGSLTTQNYHKKYVLKKFEDTFGTVIITGNLILSDDICEWLLQEGGIIVVVSRDKLESYDKEVIETTEKYWDEKTTQKYNLEVRFKKVYERLQKNNTGTDNLYLVDLGSEDTSVLESLIESSQDWMESEIVENSYEELLNLIEVRKDDENMTMEESIKKAMRDLGMDVDDTAEETPHPEKPSKKQDTKQPKQKKKPQTKPKEDFMNAPEETAENEDDSAEEVASVFVKLTDTTMALLIPAGLKLEKQVIGDMEFNVATVDLPDLSNKKLQELSIKKQEEPTKPAPTEKKPKKVEKSKKPSEKPTKVVVVSDDLKELQEEKARLDAEIKKYRADGDIDMVNALRKQRRAVRNKINKLK